MNKHDMRRQQLILSRRLGRFQGERDIKLGLVGPSKKRELSISGRAKGIFKGTEGICTPLQLLRGSKFSREAKRLWSGVRAFSSVVLGTDLLALSSLGAPSLGAPSQNSGISLPFQVSTLDLSAQSWLNH